MNRDKMIRKSLWVVVFGVCAAGLFTVCGKEETKDDAVSKLAREVHEKGWIGYSAKSENDTWDIFISRPDGSEVRNLTNTPDFEEAAPRFSADGKRMLYRRLDAGTTIDHDKWGFQGRLIIANSDGSNPVVFGEEREYSWAAWSPDGKQFSCLFPRGIEIVDIATKKVTRSIPRQGIYQALFWSPDGKWLCGVANMGKRWTIARMNVETGELNAVHEFQNCTPDWFPDSRHILFSSRPGNQDGYGWTQLWMAEGEGKNQRLVYGEDGAHIYGGALSPDGKYVLFTKTPNDWGGLKNSGGSMFVMRLSDAPMICGKSEDLRKLHADIKEGPVLNFGHGWEPCWTFAEIGENK